MEYARWAPQYERLRQAFGFPLDAEERAAERLVDLLPAAARAEPLERVARRLRGREVVVVGLAPGAGPPPLWRLPADAAGPVVVAADGAAATCLDAGLVPSVIASDLDGPVAAEVAANRRGSLVVVHAHGDNRPALEQWVPQFPGELAGSWSGPPRAGLFDVGGFTDGDRAAYLAEHVGARRVLLWGFDFGSVEEPDPAARRRKLAKLDWARRILADLAAESPVPIDAWARDGSIARYADSALASTR
ncbi:MAG TPA: 6-hydroxymethylpterin diphosphokinase MptE-like protein [Thermoplasmata archaeon]|nr:6-hydroxymethylpterin diphosphokinase MptE-like protein [Thermoplasmata archaeon]